ncbi:hypothetical protein LXL04_017768 [Taraxacum kok-saghyz]
MKEGRKGSRGIKGKLTLGIEDDGSAWSYKNTEDEQHKQLPLKHPAYKAQVVRRRNKKYEGGHDDINDLRKLVTTVYVTNLPTRWDSGRLWKECVGLGKLMDAFIPGGFDTAGGLFGFVRFLKVVNIQELLRKLNDMVVEGRRLRANVSLHPQAVRPGAGRRNDVNREGGRKGLEARHETARSSVFRRRSGPSFKEVLQGEQERGETSRDPGREKVVKQLTVNIPEDVVIREHAWLGNCLIGELKNIELLSKCFSVIQAYGLGDCSIRYIGGLKGWDDTPEKGSRIIWLKIRGVPVRLWDPEVFSYIAWSFGRVLIPFEGPIDAKDMSFGKVCMLRDSVDVVGACKVWVT